jgi:hypothetical protein
LVTQKGRVRIDVFDHLRALLIEKRIAHRLPRAGHTAGETVLQIAAKR